MYMLFCFFNPLLTIGNSFKGLYKVLAPGIKPPINSYGLMGAHDTCVIGW